MYLITFASIFRLENFGEKVDRDNAMCIFSYTRDLDGSNTAMLRVKVDNRG